MAHEQPVVVVGGGAGGHACIEAYRAAGGAGPVTLLSADDRLPYFRPELSKGVIAGTADPTALDLAPADWYGAQGVDVHLGVEVRGFDPTARVVATDAGPFGFGALVLATGSRASVPPIPGADHPDVLTLRAAADAERLVGTTAGSGRIAVIGSGFIGCEIAASLRRRGIEVVVIGEEPAPQAERLGAGVGALLDGWLRDLGVELELNARATELVVGGGGVRVGLPDDRPPVEADAVLVATGAAPNVDLWTHTGTVDGAIAVDASMRTVYADVFAVGEVAAAAHPVAGRRLRVEHWGDAVAMGAVAGANLAGEDAAWTAAPGFWSQIGDRTIKYVAWGDGWDRWHARPSNGGVTFWYERDGVVVGALTFDHDEDNAAAGTLLAGHATIDAVV